MSSYAFKYTSTIQNLENTLSYSCVCATVCCVLTLSALNLSNICSPASPPSLCCATFNPAAHLPSLITRSLLRGAEQMGMHKAVKPQFGGGMRRFSCEEDNIYDNIESELCFFTSQVRGQNCEPCEPYVKVVNITCILTNCDGFQERQSIIKYWLDNLRAKQGEVLHNIHFLEGQPISMLSFILIKFILMLFHISFFSFSLPYLIASVLYAGAFICNVTFEFVIM